MITLHLTLKKELNLVPSVVLQEGKFGSRSKMSVDATISFYINPILTATVNCSDNLDRVCVQNQWFLIR